MKQVFLWLVFIFSTISPVEAFEVPTHLQSVFYYYEPQHSDGFYNLDSHVTVQSEPKRDWGYYAMAWFWFNSNSGGYMGLQQGPEGSNKRMAIFSIWDKVYGNVKAIPVTNWCHRFSHEGFGTSCIIDYAWKPNVEYKLRIWKLGTQDDPRGIKWGGWVIDTTTGQETLIGIILTENYQNNAGYGLLANWGHAHTTEFWAGDLNATCYSAPYFNVVWKGPYGNNGTANPKYVIPRYNTGVGTHCHNKSMASDAPFSITMNFGANIAPMSETEQQANYFNKWFKLEFDQADCVFDWAERVFPGEFNQQQFPQRRLSVYHSDSKIYYRDYRIRNKGYLLGFITYSDELIIVDPVGSTYNVGEVTALARASNCLFAVR